MMKTEGSGVTEVIWTSNVDLPHLTQEQECFPVMGGCQVSSILSNLETPVADKTVHHNSEILQSMDLIVLQTDNYKVTTQSDINNRMPNHFILTKGDGNENELLNTFVESNLKSQTKSNKTKEKDDFENMLYFICNLCPYLCIKDCKITEHIENEHKNKTHPKLLQLKCPACPNIFYHKIPLRSHLIYDHKVASSDLLRIIQAVIYFSKKNVSLSKISDLKLDQNEMAIIHCKNEMDLKYIEKLVSTEKLTYNDSNEVHEDHPNDINLNNLNEEGQEISLKPDSVCLPAIDITYNNAVKTFTTAIKKKSDTISKFLDDKKLHKCSFSTCKVRLQESKMMEYHIKCHRDDSFRCPECLECFMFWKPLTGHLWRLHKIDIELHSCDQCDYKTFSLAKLNNIHKLIHGDLKAFVCDFCPKSFKNSKQLRNHKMIHKEKPNKLPRICEICTKIFTDRRQLRIHLDSVHKKIKPFLCNYCGYKAASKGALRMHIRQHTGEKPFTCNTCDYATADHNSLRRHKLRHSGQKPYKCAHCDYACIQSSTYKVHLRTKHPGLEKDLLFTCQECQYRTINHDMYMSHQFLVHRQKQIPQIDC